MNPGACELVPYLPQRLGVVLGCEAIEVALECVELFTVTFNVATGTSPALPAAGAALVSPLPGSTTFTVFNGEIPNIGICDAMFWANHYFKVYEELTASEAASFNAATYDIEINGDDFVQTSAIEEATKCWPCVVVNQPTTAPATYIVGVMNPHTQCQSIFIADDDEVTVTITLPPGLGDVLMSFNIVFGRYTTRPEGDCFRHAAEIAPSQVAVPLAPRCPAVFAWGDLVAVPTPGVVGPPSLGIPQTALPGPLGT